MLGQWWSESVGAAEACARMLRTDGRFGPESAISRGGRVRANGVREGRLNDS